MKLQVFGDYVFEFFIVTFLLITSLILVVPFIPMVVGVVGYFKKDIHSRRYKDIFKGIKENWKILVPYTIFEIVILLVSILNIYYFNTNIDKVNSVALVMSYVGLIIGIVYLFTAPTIIVNMNITFFQLIYNGFMLLLGNLKNTLLIVLMIAVVVLMILYFPYMIIFMFYFLTLFSQKLMMNNFYYLKAKALGISVEDLKNPNEEKY